MITQAWSPCGRYTVTITGPIKKERIVDVPDVWQTKILNETIPSKIPLADRQIMLPAGEYLIAGGKPFKIIKLKETP